MIASDVIVVDPFRIVTPLAVSRDRLGGKLWA